MGAGAQPRGGPPQAVGDHAGGAGEGTLQGGRAEAHAYLVGGNGDLPVAAVAAADARRPGGSRGHGPPLLLVGHQVPLVDAHRSAPSSLMTSGTSDTRSRVTTSVFQPFSVIIWSAVAARCRLLNGPAAMDVSMNGEVPITMC